MKRLFFPLICLKMLFLGSFLPLGALEIELFGGQNSMTLSPDKVTAYDPEANFKGYPFLYGELTAKGVISENLRYEGRFQRDNILLNSLSGQISTSMEYLNVEFGPFIGIGDKLENPYYGFTGGIELAFPGIVFFSISGSSTIFSEMDFTGDTTRESGEIKLGFWLPNLIIDFSINSKSLTRQHNNSTEICDVLTRFQFSADFHVKNYPLIFRLDTGYETLSRSYRSEIEETTDELNAIYIGFDAKIQVLRQLRIIAGFEMPFFIQKTTPKEATVDILSLYRFKAGIAYAFF